MVNKRYEVGFDARRHSWLMSKKTFVISCRNGLELSKLEKQISSDSGSPQWHQPTSLKFPRAIKLKYMLQLNE